MEYGISNISIIPCRLEPSDTSEMVSQVLFGEHFEVLEKRKKWSRIRLALDNYESWIDNKQFVPITDKDFDGYSSQELKCSLELVALLQQQPLLQMTPITMGASLPGSKPGVCEIQDNTYGFEGQVSPSVKEFKKSRIVEYAYLYLNAPYLWGGRTPFGIDCSGFTQIVYKLNGIRLPRDSHEQALLGDGMSFIEEAEPGDLAFFDNDQGKIVHVGIILKDDHIIHASGKVRLDRIDHQGIFDPEIGRHTHKLRIIKRII